jgi:hypothetical protein
MPVNANDYLTQKMHKPVTKTTKPSVPKKKKRVVVMKSFVDTIIRRR